MTQKQKILLAFIVPGLTALVAVWLFVERSHQRLVIERWSNENRALVHSISHTIQERLDSTTRALDYTGQLPDFDSLSSVDRIDHSINGIPSGLERNKRKALDALLAGPNNLAVAFILLPDGDLYLAHPYAIQQSLKKHNLADRAYFQEAKNGKKLVFSDSFIGLDGLPAVVVNNPLIGQDGQIYAHLGGVLHLSEISKLLAASVIAPFDYGLLTDRQGMLIGRSDNTLINAGKSLQKAEFPFSKEMSAVTHDISFKRWTDAQGIVWLSFVSPLDSGWKLVLSRRLESVTEEIEPASRQITLLVALILLVTGSLGVALAMRFAKRWEASDYQLTLARDHLEQRVEQRTRELSESQGRVQKSLDFYLTVLEHFPTLIWRAGTNSKCNYFNATWLEFTGRSMDQELGDGWMEGVHSEDLPACLETYHTHFKARMPFSMEYRMRRHDGEYRWITDMGRPFNDIEGKFAGYLGTCFDVTQRHRAAEQLSLIASVFMHIREGIIISDAKGNIVDVNQAFSQITGYQRNEVLGKNISTLNAKHQGNGFYKMLWSQLNESGQWQGEHQNLKKSGEAYIERLDISAVRDEANEICHYVGIFSDVSQQKEHEQHLENLAHFDPLTGLPNRTLLHDRLHMSIALANRNKTQLAVCMLDLDGFKAVNDHYGHAAGDRLLIEFSQRTQGSLRDTDTLSRLGGDEFVILLNDLDNLEQGLDVIRRILAEASLHYEIDGNRMTVSASVGVTVHPDDGVDPDLLLRHADQAMYIAKQTGRNRYFLFDPMKDQVARTEMAALQALEAALRNREFELFYQPKVDMQRGVVTGAEALIRWRHPERGLIHPGDFLPVTENSDFAITLGDWVIGEALRQADAWHHQGLQLSISINIAARHLSLANFTARLGLMLSLHPTLPHGRIELEILETAALSDTSHVSEVIESCRALGISFALDDFGTGYSSLLYLKHLPAQTLKIDQSFVCDMKIDAEDLAIVKGVIGLAQAFNRSVIAEGVETTALGDTLLDLGCIHAQGYGIARPMPSAEFRDWLAAWRAPLSWQANRVAER
jgi:diguanylate cyclase (GGDEF)-like protein/PAS domain S-box-containing protein